MPPDESDEEGTDELTLLFDEGRPASGDLVERVIAANVRKALFGDDVESAIPALGRLTLISPIGTGAMGSVLEAHDPVLDRRVAVKVVHHTSEATRVRALQEARHLAKLSHAHVVGVFDVGEFEGGVYLVMEHVQGTTLRAWADETRSMKDVLRVMRAAGEGIAAAHKAHITHRDIKPDNILVGDGGEVKIADFGVAEASHSAGRLAGTEGYFAPELLAGGTASRRSDQYAFFVTLGETLERTGADVPSWLRLVIERGMSEAPKDRYGSMREALDALSPGRNRRRQEWGMLALVALICAPLLIVLTLGDNPVCGGVLHERHPWGAAPRAELRAKIDSITGFGASALERLFARLDESASTWTSVRDEVCEAELAPEVLTARASCLVHEREQIQAWARAAESLQSVSEFSRVAAALERVSDPSRCSGVETNEDGRLIDAGGEQSESELIRDGHALLAEAEVSLALGAYPAAAFIMDAVLETTRDIGDPAFVARRSYIAGRLAARHGDAAAAEEFFETAMQNAARAGAARLEANIWLGVVRNEVLSGSPARALEWSPFATAALGRARLSTRELAGMEGEAYKALGDYARAVERLTFALEGDGELGPVRRAIAHMNLGRVARDEDRPLSAITHCAEALAIAEEALGEGHPGRAMYIDQRGSARLAAGDATGAIEDHTRAITIRSEAYGEDDRAVASSLMNLAEASLEVLRFEDAESHIERASAIRRAIFHGDPVREVPLNLLRGRVAMERGDFPLAQRLFAAAVENISPVRRERTRAALALFGRSLIATSEFERGADTVTMASADAQNESLQPSAPRCALWSVAQRIAGANFDPRRHELRRGERLCAGDGAQTLLSQAEARGSFGEDPSDELQRLRTLSLSPRSERRIERLVAGAEAPEP